jgi:predicted unusual protein kinase regulating ubiquinone biosynthesis (AarF/ABC1/UbiB family)
MLRSRYRRIVLFFARVISSFVVWDLVLPRLGLRSWARRTRPDRLRRSAVAFRSLAIQMGGVLIKVGQFLSSRVDVLPEEVTNELSGLQDEVPPAPFDQIRVKAEKEFGLPLEEKFARFEEAPLAAASLGQVYKAWVQTGTADEPGEGLQDVVVKILRPGIETIIATDLAALQTVGNWLQRYGPIRRRANVPALLAEFTRILYQEIDYEAEGRNAETFAANFQDDPGVRVPEVIWSHTTPSVLTLENVWAIKITDYPAITAAGIDRAAVASRLLNTYLQQIFEDGFFHADPHPGNLFVQPRPSPPEEVQKIPPDWRLTFVDFGMVGRVPPNLRTGLRELLIGVGTQDARRVVQSYEMLGVLLPGADLELLEKAEAKAFERFWGKNMTELSQISPQEVHEFTGEFRELIYTLPFQVPHDLIFLARAVGILSGMCTGLDPDFNLWEHLAPYARKLMAEEARAGGESILAELGKVFTSLISVPRKMDSMLSRIERGEVAVRVPEVTRQVNHLQNAIRQVAWAIIFAALLISGIQLYLSGQTPFAEILLALAGVILAWVTALGLRKG